MKVLVGVFAFCVVLSTQAAESVNTQITDAVTQSNVKVVAESPAQAMGTMYQTLSQGTYELINQAPNQVSVNICDTPGVLQTNESMQIMCDGSDHAPAEIIGCETCGIYQLEEGRLGIVKQ